MSKATSVDRSLFVRPTAEPQNPEAGQIWNDAGVIKVFRSGSWITVLLAGDVVSSEGGSPIAISAYHNTNDQTGLPTGETQANITLTETNEGGFTIVSNNIVIPAGASGLYIVQGQITTDGFSDQTVMQGKIKVNGSIVSNNYQVNARANDFNSKAITGKPLMLNAGDTVGLFMDTSGASGRIVHGSEVTYLTLTKIGGTV